MAAARNASHTHSYLTYPLKYELFPKDMATLAKANSIKAMAVGFKVLAAMTDMVIGDKQLLEVRSGQWCCCCQKPVTGFTNRLIMLAMSAAEFDCTAFEA